jgi:cell fate regulator YaaT (PSP1 superfamily)
MVKVAGIQFKENGKVYYFNSNKLKLNNKVTVIVETEKGDQFGTVVSIEEQENSKKLKNVLRTATKKDYITHQKNTRDAKKALDFCNKKAEEMKLNMKLIDASYTFDRSQLLFSFVSEERVDFRNLVKELARKYHTRIELRQVGIRDKAKSVGGLGPCGRELCCISFLQEFDSISISHAKKQNLTLNPNKINGACGRLKCCLKYESDQYSKMKKEMPEVGKMIKYKGKKVPVISVNLLKKTYRIKHENEIIEVEVKDNDGSNK